MFPTRSAAYVASAALAAGESDEEGLLADIAGTVAKDFACAERDLSLKVGASVTPEFTGDNGLVIKYEVADPEVVAVENGAIKALAAGNTTVTASIGTAKVVLNVAVSAASLASETTDYELIYNSENEKSATLAVTADGVAADNAAIEWQSSAPEVVSVENGVITALASGEATVTASYQGGTLEFNVTAWYGIYSTTDFQNMFVVNQDLSGNYKLMDNVILDDWIEYQMYAESGVASESCLDFAHQYDKAYRLTGVFDGNNKTLTIGTCRIFNGIHGGTLKNLTVVSGRMGIWGGVFGYAMDNNALIENVTVYTTLGTGNHCGRVVGDNWYFAAAGALFYSASSSVIKDSNIYVNIPTDIDLNNGGAVAVNAIRAISNDAGSFEGGTMVQIENTNAYSNNTSIGFAGGMEISVQEWDGVVEVSTVNDLSIYGNAGYNVKLTEDLSIDFGGDVFNACVIDSLNSTIDGNGHTITINATHSQQNQPTHKNLIKTINESGVLKNATIIYNLIYAEGIQNALNASLLTSKNNGTMQDLDVTFNFVEKSGLNCWFNLRSGYLSWDGTGSYIDMTIRLTGNHLFLRSADQPDAEYGRCGIVNADGSAATVTNMTIYGIEATQPIGLLAPTKEITNNIIATNVVAIKDFPA